MTTRYRKLAQHEEQDREESAKKQRAQRVERITAKIHAAFWVTGAALLIYYTDIFHVAFNDSRVNRVCLDIGIACAIANLCIVVYLTIWLPYIQKVTLPWDIYCPRMIPAATVIGVLCGIMFIAALWPVWGLWSPLIISVLFMGMIFATHFIPWPC